MAKGTQIATYSGQGTHTDPMARSRTQRQGTGRHETVTRAHINDAMARACTQ